MPTTGTQFQISKLDDSQSLVFGYANVSVSKCTSIGSGNLIKDLQADIIAPDDLERAAYEFVLNFRETDEMHAGDAVGQLVESMVFTPDKLVKLATDPTTGTVDQPALEAMQRILPPRWWVGFKLAPTSYQAVKSGKFKMFSIAGEADREEVYSG